MPPPADLVVPATRPADLDRDNPVRSVLLVLAAMAVFSCADAISKVLAGELPAVEIAWMRWVGFVAIMVPSLLASRGALLRTAIPHLQIARGLAMVGSSVMFMKALAALPMATATTMAFVSPLLVTALSIPFLGERVGPRRWAAVGIGLVGVVIVVRPGTQAFHAAAVFPLLSALFWAFGIVLTRRIGHTDGTLTTMSYAALVGFAALSLAVPFEWATPTWRQAGLAAAMAAASTLAQFCTVVAYRGAPASLLAPLAYSQLIWSSALGAVLFGQVPDGYTWLGAAVIVASGVYTAHRERVRGARP